MNYSHCINRLHKDIRSSTTVSSVSKEDLPDFSYPILSAFAYNMSSGVDEASDRHRKISEHHLYRYPDVVKGVASSLQKVHDMYGLDTISVGVTYWQRINEILKVAKGGGVGP